MTSESQRSDKLKAILGEARARATFQLAHRSETREAAAKDLVNKDAALPDPMALARLYQSLDLRAKLPEDAAETPGEQPTSGRPAGWEELPGPTAPPGADEPKTMAAGDPGHDSASPTRPAMSAAEMREVMGHLQQTFQVSERSYETYELSSRPVDDLPVISTAERDLELAEAIAAVEAARGGTGLYLVGAGLVLAVVAVFILLAVNGVGPFKPAPNASPSPAVTATT